MSAIFDENNNIVSGTLNIGSGIIYDIILSDTSGSRTVFNQNNLDIDFAVSGINQGDVLFFDASKGRVGINVTNPDAALHIVSDCAYDGLKIESETNCATGVRLLLVHNSQTYPETGSYPVTIDLAGRDNNYNNIIYGQIKSRILNPATFNTSGELIFTVDHTGVNKEIFRSSLLNTVLGGMNTVSGQLYNVIGYNNSVTGLSYIVIGNMNNSIHNTGIVIGNNTTTTGDKLLVLSNNSTIHGSHNISLSVDCSIRSENSISVGQRVSSTGNNIIIIGNDNIVNGDQFIGMVSDADIIGQSGLGFGMTSSVSGNNVIYIGHSVDIKGNNQTVIGSYINATGNNNIVYGNLSDLSGNYVISIGDNNNPQNINSGIFIGNNLSLSDSSQSVIIGLGNLAGTGLDNSVVLGLNNRMIDGQPSDLVIVGQSNHVSVIRESVVLGNANNLSGTVYNNIIVGPRNHVPNTSTNNLVVGILNNTSGIIINTDGSINGTDFKTPGSNMSNTTVFGINNWVSAASGSIIFGNKTRISGLNINNIGSYTNINGSNIQNFGNSNFILGSNNSAIGSKNNIFGNSSISMNTSSDRNEIFGSGNIVLGHNEVVVSGMSIGYNNEIYGPRNIIYGNNNTLGLNRHPCLSSGNNIVIIGDVDDFNGGDSILVVLYSPASQLQSVYNRIILDGVDEFGDPLGIIKENIGSNYTTTLITSETINSDNTIEYYIKDTFDDIIHGLNPCDVCFADRFAGYSSGYVIPYQRGNDLEDLSTYPFYGNRNVVLGSNNDIMHYANLVVGNNNNIISGINNIIVGYNISGLYNNTLQFGTNNLNKVVLDDLKVVFNTGAFQTNFYINTSNPDGANNANSVLAADLDNNRVGINTVNPRSTLDVSGVLTTANLRVGLSGIPGYSLFSDINGNASWQFPVNLSGQNNGLLFKVSDKIGSGIREFIFNTGTKNLEYLRANKVLHDTFFFSDEATTEDRIVIISPEGLFINNAGNDYGYDVHIKGSGIQSPVNGDNSIYLFKTLIDQNSVRMHNITGVSGVFGQMKVYQGLDLPLNLTGTTLSVNNNGNLISRTFDRYGILFNGINFNTTGNNAFRYYPNSQTITIGLTGTPPLIADSDLIQGNSNTFNHIILGANNSVNTVFNNAGLGNQFIIVESGQAGTKQGFHYHTAYGSLGIGVNDTNLWTVSSIDTNKPWWEAGKLIVNGKIRATGLQLTPQGVTIPGASSVNKYLKIIDVNGNVGLDTLDLSYQFSGIHPLAVTTDPGNQVVTIRLATTNSNGVSLGSASNGLMVVWNGSSWVQSRGFSFPQPENGSTNTDVTPGIKIGNDLGLNSCRNNHVLGGGSFVRGVSSFEGSSQESRFYLRGRTGGDVSSELNSNWHKNSATTPTAENTISLQYTDSYDNENPADHKRTIVWNYTVNYSAVFSDDAGTPTFGGCAGKVEGSLMSYIGSDGTRITTKLGADAITKRYNTVDYSTTDPISVTIKDTGSDLSTKRLAVTANGKAGYNGLWSIVVDINQAFMPSGINFGNSDIV